MMKKSNGITYRAQVLNSLFDEQEKLLDALSQRGWKRVAVWGAGKNGRVALSCLMGTSITVEAVYDDADMQFEPWNILKPTSCVSLPPVPVVIAISRVACDTTSIERRLHAEQIPYLYFEPEFAKAKPTKVVPPAKPLPRCSLRGSLTNLKQNGFEPAVVLDVGAAFGRWTQACLPMFPDAQYVMVEPLKAQYEPFLEQMRAARSSQLKVVYAAASDETGEGIINLHPDWTSSSLFKEAEGAFVDGDEVPIMLARLDSIEPQLPHDGPILLKVDTQGNELRVLVGAGPLLNRCEVVLLEVSFYSFFKNGPLFPEILDFMSAQGFVLHDFAGFHYKLLDGALAQGDAVFVRSDSSLHATIDFATREQRKEKVDQFRAAVDRLNAKKEHP